MALGPRCCARDRRSQCRFLDDVSTGFPSVRARMDGGGRTSTPQSSHRRPPALSRTEYRLRPVPLSTVLLLPRITLYKIDWGKSAYPASGFTTRHVGIVLGDLCNRAPRVAALGPRCRLRGPLRCDLSREWRLYGCGPDRFGLRRTGVGWNLLPAHSRRRSRAGRRGWLCFSRDTHEANRSRDIWADDALVPVSRRLFFSHFQGCARSRFSVSPDTLVFRHHTRAHGRERSRAEQRRRKPLLLLRAGRTERARNSLVVTSVLFVERFDLGASVCGRHGWRLGMALKGPALGSVLPRILRGHCCGVDRSAREGWRRDE